MDKNKVVNLLKDSNIRIGVFHEHSKASECYVEVTFIQEDGFTWDTIVPYVNRRAGLFLETEEELVAYLKSVKPFFQKSAMEEWRETEIKEWEKSKADVTKEFFFALLTFRPVIEFPPNDNPARRIQDIKDAGYTVATIHHYKDRKSARILLPIPKAAEMGYETFTPQFKARVIRLLKGVNAYEDKPTTPKGLIPDHKFSEVRWDKDTKAENPMDMSDDEIIQKFQLLDNQRNQQKREVCRNCFQTGKRGVIYGIPFFYKGGADWDAKIPKIGKIAENGCVGCAWYDIERWRLELVRHLNGNNIKTYGSVCSGIEAASFVLEPLGVKPLWLSEIADFPKRFLATKYAHIPNLGDMNDIPQMIEEGKVDAPDFLCGGTPCQAFSLAGWKNGLNDNRGQLTLKYIDILNAIDKKRFAQGQSRSCFMWENVEGVLKDKTNAFGYFLAGLLDLEEPVECSRWPNAGAICGKERNIAWRVLDAKYFGVPQQRKRLYVLGGGKDFNPSDILFETGENIPDPFALNVKSSQPSLFDKDCTEERSLTATVNGHSIEVFRQYSDCLYAAYGTKWNGNAASFNGSLFVCQDGRVRRLTPKECERLMGFPDDYTNIAPDVRVTNRYQAIGNSWAVPVVSWILTRAIQYDLHHIVLPESTIELSNSNYTFFNLEGFVKSGYEWINASSYPYDYKLTHMIDVIDTDAPEKYYLSPAGCAGIIRRKLERNSGINERLEFHLRNGFNNDTSFLFKRKKIR